MRDMGEGWRKVWWRICARFWAAQSRRCLRQARCFADYHRAVVLRHRSEKFFQRIKGGQE